MHVRRLDTLCQVEPRSLTRERTYAVIAAQIGTSPDQLRRAVIVVRLALVAAVVTVGAYLVVPGVVAPAACIVAALVGAAVYARAVRDLGRR